MSNLDDQVDKLEAAVDPNTVVSIGGYSFTPAKLMMAGAIVSSVLGTLYGAFEVYKDYMGMKEIIQSIDTTAIENRNQQIEQKLNDAIEYTRDIKNGLRENILSIERQADRTERMVRESEEKVRQQIDIAAQRFDNKRDQLQNDYDQKAGALRDSTDRKIKDVEDRLNAKIQRALDNPLAN